MQNVVNRRSRLRGVVVLRPIGARQISLGPKTLPLVRGPLPVQGPLIVQGPVGFFF